SIGSETATGPPYWVFKALPVMYADKLGPEGLSRFGFLYEKPGDDLPIGVSRRRLAADRAVHEMLVLAFESDDIMVDENQI
ncbi:hypothetical protein AB9F39_37990, partial [Rhizobium leguminosarum]